MPAEGARKYLRLLLLLPFGWLVVQTAWVGDDAYITFRSIQNLLHGYGPVFNVGERVQTFTHPLWLFVQALANSVLNWWPKNPLGTGQLYFVNVLLTIGLSLLAVVVVCLWIAADSKGAVLAVLLLLVSKAFIDYSTSGLENPLGHLLIFCFLALYFEELSRPVPRLFALGLIAALAGLNRIDLLLLFLPALALLLWNAADKSRALRALAAGFAPLLLWELFSLFYYGGPVPNTALAKLNTGIHVPALLLQGGYYMLNSLRLDPITLVVIVAVMAWSFTRRDSSGRVLALGMLLYLIYTLWIGGDFMSGRYFTAPLAVSAAIISRLRFGSLGAYAVTLALVLTIGLAPIWFVPQRSPSYGEGKGLYAYIDDQGISDERRFYYGQMGFLMSLRAGAPAGYASGSWVHTSQQPEPVQLVGTLGISGFRAGPNVHVIDRNALADPLMSRMPLQDPSHWRIGHFRHIIPDGYLETLRTGESRIADPNIASYYGKLSFVVRGQLWDPRRLTEIWNLNTGKYENLLPGP